ncbi:uncharacterized protein LOC62_04G005531 [Vanrija pseudolonga]|uniref:Uncharacterized protein n=1 Tax=Vanrija pseudolonga TaxID=143232 RepID=A0AAF0YEG6_9TREE|nr:hypothetical protein LOC62_04G005531 [Vanrija pseudolonga]
MATYQRLPTSPQDDPADERRENELSLENPLSEATIAQFNAPEPAWWKRAALIVAIIVMSWLAIKLGGMGGEKKKPDVIYATRYSDEFKYRPAASPIITEHLKDGRIRIRGATPGGMGVREADMPKTPEQRAYELRLKKEEALEAAKQKFKEGKAKRAAGKSGKGKRKRTGRGNEP